MSPLAKIEKDFKSKDIISLNQFDTGSIQLLFDAVKKIKKLENNPKLLEILKGKIVSLLFFEPSTRTFSSFAAAVKRLGGQTIEYQNPLQTSSTVKGESIKDMTMMIQNYSDAIVVRHSEVGTAQKIAETAGIPVLNAGDGIGEHPTQALLDIYTIFETHHRLTNLTGLIAGDLLNGRTVHSLLQALSLYKGNTVYLLSPEELELSKDDYTKYSPNLTLITIHSEKEIPTNCQFWYWTRVQKERFAKESDYIKVKNKFIVTPDLLAKKGNKQLILMHPLPRVGEITVEVDKDPRAVYLTRQSKNGLYVRMALLSLILGKVK